MNVLIVEDEAHAAKRLGKILTKLEPNIHLLEVLDSIEETVSWWQNNAVPDLVFMDIQLADGLSFEIFRQVEVTCPVVFISAYDEYAIHAFRVNGLDYLLKPIEEKELAGALKRFKELGFQGLTPEAVEKLLGLKRQDRKYRERFLIKVGDQLKFVPVEEAAWFQSDSGYINLGVNSGQKLLLDTSLDQLREELDPERFYQINRKVIVSIDAVSKIYTHLNSRLKLELSPSLGEEVIVSRDRVKGFKEWLDK